ncbi:MAG: EamA family transporter [Candidatus Rokubacteria bacterium]|nr:EamA family transporter [Candidatus Rokubacteria bacterium]
MKSDVVLLLANVVYGTSSLASRIALDAVPPATLGLVRLLLGALVLAVAALAGRERVRLHGRDAWRVFWMGVLGFAGAYALANWGLVGSTVTNAALLIIVEPVVLIALAPLLLGERLTHREAWGAPLTLVGAMIVVTNGIPGVTERLFPSWRGDLLLVASGVAYALYSLIGRRVLLEHRPVPVTLLSIAWGIAGIMPLAAAEWLRGETPRWSAGSAVAALYLGVVVTGLGYLVWNSALARVTAARAGIFLTVQPVVGVLSGVLVRGEHATAFTAVGGSLIVLGLAATMVPRPRSWTARPVREHEGTPRA